MVKTAVDILRRLVAIPSVSSLPNQEMIDYAAKRLKGWDIAFYPYRDAAWVDKMNLVAQCGPPGTAELALVCHTDTVPLDLAWKGALDSAVRGGKLYGCGSCDVKGFLACVLAAVSQIDVRRLSKPLALVLTADEEVGCVGAKFLAEKKAVRARYTLIGEPTGLRPIRAGKGYALAEIVVRGKEAHSAFPSAGRSAIFDAARIVTPFGKPARKNSTRKNHHFDPPATNVNIRLIHTLHA